MFGGLNLCLAGDLWQLGPVRDCPMFSHPLRKTDGTRYEAIEQRMLAMLWDWNKPGFKNGLQHLFELTQPKRNSNDRWLQMLLTECRSGNQSWEVYCFVHGLPTKNPGSWLPDEDQIPCGDPLCATLAAAAMAFALRASARRIRRSGPELDDPALRSVFPVVL